MIILKGYSDDIILVEQNGEIIDEFYGSYFHFNYDLVIRGYHDDYKGWMFEVVRNPNEIEVEIKERKEDGYDDLMCIINDPKMIDLRYNSQHLDWDTYNTSDLLESIFDLMRYNASRQQIKDLAEFAVNNIGDGPVSL